MKFVSGLWYIAVDTRITHKCTQEQSFKKERKGERKENQCAVPKKKETWTTTNKIVPSKNSL